MTIAQLPLPDFMRPRAARSPSTRQGLLIDVFAGFGGASIAMERAYGRPVDEAINHWQEAISLHARNHPFPTVHHTADVWEVDPRTVRPGEPVDHIHLSPDCRHHSNARGGTPVSDGVRCLAWVVLRWAKLRRPAMITMENVREFLHWGPTMLLIKNGVIQRDKNGDPLRVPDPAKKGVTFFDGFLRRASKILPSGGRCGFLLPAYAVQTPSRVLRWKQDWSIDQALVPRTLFQRLSLPLVFLMFAKERPCILTGFALYEEAQDITEMPAKFKLILTHGKPGIGVWRAMVA